MHPEFVHFSGQENSWWGSFWAFIQVGDVFHGFLSCHVLYFDEFVGIVCNNQLKK